MSVLARFLHLTAFNGDPGPIPASIVASVSHAAFLAAGGNDEYRGAEGAGS